MNPFMDSDFLLETATAKTLYHSYAKNQPIVDYHCHISPAQLADDCTFTDLAQLWLAGDHYKWRLMRTNGVPEAYITGNKSGWEKFQAFAEALSRAIGNPMYHWVHLELQRYFACNTPLSPDTAAEIWAHCNAKLQKGMSARQIVRQSGVSHIVTTDDPADSLEHHKRLAADDSFATQVLPGFRPDRALAVAAQAFPAYMAQLGASCGLDITSFAQLKQALTMRIEYFSQQGCRACDHGMDYAPFALADDQTLEATFHKALIGEPLTVQERDSYQTALLLHLAEAYNQRGWVMELHFSTLRNPNTNALAEIGADTGFDCIRSGSALAGLPQLLDVMYQRGILPKTIVFSNNPADNAIINTTLGSFQDSSARAKLQQGSAWWFNDTKQGMLDQMVSMASLGVLGNFVGMLTDSRSLLSYVRHEYFRRILCNLLGGWVENGEYPHDLRQLEVLIGDICCGNARRFFNLP